MKAGSWASILGIYLFGVCGSSTVSKIIPLAADIVPRFGLSDPQFGWLIALIAVPAVLLAIPSGLVVDRFGPKPVLIVAAIVAGLADGLYIVAQQSWVLHLARLIEGTAVVHIYTAGPTLLMAATQGNRRTHAMTFWATYAPVGTALGFALGGLFAETDRWQMSFVLHGALLLLAALLCTLQPQPDRSSSRVVRTLASQVAELGSAYARPALLALGLAVFLLISMGFGANTTFPDWFVNMHGIGRAQAAGGIALATLLMVPGSIGAGALLGRGVASHRLFLLLAPAGFIAGTLAFYPPLDLAVRYGAAALWFLCSGAAMAVAMAVLPNVAEPERRGAAAALVNQAGAIAILVNPPLWRGLLADGEWTPFAWILAAGWSLATIAMLVLATRSRRDAGMEKRLA
jgi:predicted MFS family arabinose efflux permease